MNLDNNNYFSLHELSEDEKKAEYQKEIHSYLKGGQPDIMRLYHLIAMRELPLYVDKNLKNGSITARAPEDCFVISQSSPNSTIRFPFVFFCEKNKVVQGELSSFIDLCGYKDIQEQIMEEKRQENALRQNVLRQNRQQEIGQTLNRLERIIEISDSDDE